MQQIRAQLGEFVYDTPTSNDGVRRERREMVVLDNRAKYEGEWNVANNTKDGKGI